MEIIPPLSLELAYTGTLTPPEYIAEEWESNSSYYPNEVVRYQIDGIWYDWRALYYIYGGYYWEVPGYNEGSYWARWRRIGPSAVILGESREYETEVTLSLNNYWSTGVAVSSGTIVFDELDQNDYVSLTDITSGNNTTRPSSAVKSSDETIAGYWQLFGAGNAWAANDYELATKTSFVDTDGDPIVGDAWCGYWITNASANLIAVPNNFTSTYWSLTGCTITADTTASPLGGDTAADTYTKTSATNNMYRTFGSAITGRRVILSVWAKLLTTSGTGTSQIKLIFREGSTIKTLHTFTLPSGWTYFQVYHEVTSATQVYVGIAAEGVTATMALWGAHMGYVGAAFNRVIFAGVEDASLVRMEYYPYCDLDNGRFSEELKLERSCANRLRHDLSQSKTVYADVFADDQTTIQTNTGLIYATDTSIIYFYASAADPSIAAKIGSFAVGEATTLADTEWGVESSILSFSKKERNDTFGTVSFVKRGNAKQVRATGFIDTSVISGDEVQAVLSAFEGQPVFYDFNNPGGDYDRLRVFGFQTNLRTVISTPTWESLSLDIEGLVE